ncbi:MAG: hypothetical protein GXO31_07280 [Epsilonproteobacteria bacterium]|nr:hypothetical protein [Campylobacterota bacterium]
MKSSKEIIAQLTSKPYMRKISYHHCFNKLKSLLPKHLSDAILFIYIKNNTMFFALNHPGMKMEFQYKQNLLKSLLQNLMKLDPQCSNLEDLKSVKQIKSFISNKSLPPIQNISSITVRRYKERARGKFINFATDREIKKIFEQIRKEIKKEHA